MFVAKIFSFLQAKSFTNLLDTLYFTVNTTCEENNNNSHNSVIILSVTSSSLCAEYYCYCLTVIVC